MEVTGQYGVLSRRRALCDVLVGRAQQASGPLLEDREAWPAVGLNEELVVRITEARFHVGISLLDPGDSIPDAVVFATLLADRLSDLGTGCVEDIQALRHFGPGTWRVEELIAEIDCREHVSVHIVSEESGGAWLHTHGLIKFGRPEFEIYEVPSDLAGRASIGMLDISQYVVGGALIRPGETMGDPAVPLHARLGTRNHDHWEDVPVLELVDVDASGRPADEGAARAFRAWIGSAE
jgi:hypothetical protein